MKTPGRRSSPRSPSRGPTSFTAKRSACSRTRIWSRRIFSRSATTSRRASSSATNIGAALGGPIIQRQIVLFRQLRSQYPGQHAQRRARHGPRQRRSACSIRSGGLYRHALSPRSASISASASSTFKRLTITASSSPEAFARKRTSVTSAAKRRSTAATTSRMTSTPPNSKIALAAMDSSTMRASIT